MRSNYYFKRTNNEIYELYGNEEGARGGDERKNVCLGKLITKYYKSKATTVWVFKKSFHLKALSKWLMQEIINKIKELEKEIDLK